MYGVPHTATYSWQQDESWPFSTQQSPTTEPQLFFFSLYLFLSRLSRTEGCAKINVPIIQSVYIHEDRRHCIKSRIKTHFCLYLILFTLPVLSAFSISAPELYSSFSSLSAFMCACFFFNVDMQVYLTCEIEGRRQQNRHDMELREHSSFSQQPC